ncbi:hypothetical protein ACCO45_006014 [Purpureocillium lilacinum]|uniref:Uncharacterized protein n=1 Tax=Purpureocillium lilacinum TaxID=33203 RepID=A0ACC4DXW0_PURLI
MAVILDNVLEHNRVRVCDKQVARVERRVGQLMAGKSCLGGPWLARRPPLLAHSSGQHLDDGHGKAKPGFVGARCANSTNTPIVMCDRSGQLPVRHGGVMADDGLELAEIADSFAEMTMPRELVLARLELSRMIRIWNAKRQPRRRLVRVFPARELGRHRKLFQLRLPGKVCLVESRLSAVGRAPPRACLWACLWQLTASDIVVAALGVRPTQAAWWHPVQVECSSRAPGRRGTSQVGWRPGLSRWTRTGASTRPPARPASMQPAIRAPVEKDDSREWRAASASEALEGHSPCAVAALHERKLGADSTNSQQTGIPARDCCNAVPPAPPAGRPSRESRRGHGGSPMVGFGDTPHRALNPSIHPSIQSMDHHHQDRHPCPPTRPLLPLAVRHRRAVWARRTGRGFLPHSPPTSFDTASREVCAQLWSWMAGSWPAEEPGRKRWATFPASRDMRQDETGRKSKLQVLCEYVHKGTQQQRRPDGGDAGAAGRAVPERHGRRDICRQWGQLRAR